jgi:hypothetical protein
MTKSNMPITRLLIYLSSFCAFAGIGAYFRHENPDVISIWYKLAFMFGMGAILDYFWKEQ